MLDLVVHGRVVLNEAAAVAIPAVGALLAAAAGFSQLFSP